MFDRIRDLARALTEDDDRRPHLAPVRARVSVPAGTDALASLNRELAEEMASSLGRAARHVQEALDALAALDHALERAGSPARRDELVAAFNAKRTEAVSRLRDLKIQREALGFRRHDDLERHYPIPPRR